jgi:hypothetical protein
LFNYCDNGHIALEAVNCISTTDSIVWTIDGGESMTGTKEISLIGLSLGSHSVKYSYSNYCGGSTSKTITIEVSEVSPTFVQDIDCDNLSGSIKIVGRDTVGLVWIDKATEKTLAIDANLTISGSIPDSVLVQFISSDTVDFATGNPINWGTADSTDLIIYNTVMLEKFKSNIGVSWSPTGIVGVATLVNGNGYVVFTDTLQISTDYEVLVETNVGVVLTAGTYKIYWQTLEGGLTVHPHDGDSTSFAKISDKCGFYDFVFRDQQRGDCGIVSTIDVQDCILLSNQDPLRNNIIVLPNPTEDVAYVTFSKQGSYQLSLYSLTGETVLIQNSTNVLKQRVDVSSLSNGMYIIKILDKETKQITALKLLVK